MKLIIFILIFHILNPVSSSENCVRVRRYLAFPENSQFFIRLNFKANMVPWNQIFAQALGFRINYETHALKPHLRLRRSDLFKNVRVLFDKNNIDGYHCIRRAICEVKSLKTQFGVYQKLLKIIFRYSSDTKDWHRMSLQECDASVAACPVSLLDILPYTDL